MLQESQIKPDQKKPVVTKLARGLPFRVFRPKLEMRQCKKLYGCYAFCPENSIIIEKGFPSITDACTGCLICVRECKCRALIEEREHD